jgi:hypothetical protein
MMAEDDESNNGDLSSPPRKIFKDHTAYLFKRGPKKGSKNMESKTVTDWYNACVAYRSQPTKTTIAFFLRSDASGPKFSGSKSECVGLGQYLKQYDVGSLEPVGDLKRRRNSTKFDAVERKLINDVDLHSRHWMEDAPPLVDNDDADDGEPEHGVLDPIDIHNDNEDRCFATLLQVKEAVYKLRISSRKLGIDASALVHLDRYEKAVEKAGFAKKKKPTTIHDYFTKKNNN